MSLPTIRVDGTTLREDSGKRFFYVGVSAFPWFARYLMRDGRHALVDPLLQEVRASAVAGGYGDRPIVARVFRYAATWNAFALQPWSYPMATAAEFTRYLADQNFYVDWTCGDAQAVLTARDGGDGQQEHQNQFCAAHAQLPCIIQRCNERFKNGVRDEVTVPKWGPYLTCSGDYGELKDWPWTVFDLWDYHGGRDSGGLTPFPKWLVDMNDQAAQLTNLIGKPGRLGEPRRLDEIAGFDNRAELWRLMGEVAGYCGVTLHSQYGREGRLMGPVTRAGHEAFFAGAAGVIDK